MICKNCGTELQETSKFCFNCGSKVEYESSTENISTKENSTQKGLKAFGKSLYILLISLPLFIISFLLEFWVKANKSGSDGLVLVGFVMYVISSCGINGSIICIGYDTEKKSDININTIQRRNNRIVLHILITSILYGIFSIVFAVPLALLGSDFLSSCFIGSVLSFFVILPVSYQFTDAAKLKKNRLRANGIKDYKRIILPILIVGIIGCGVCIAARKFLKENNIEVSTRVNSGGIVRTLYDDSFYVSAQSHVPIYFSTSGGKVSIKAESDRKVEFITMSRYEYENRVSLALGYRCYSEFSSESTYIDSVGELPAGDYVFAVQCVGFHTHERKVHVTIKETLQ